MKACHSATVPTAVSVRGPGRADGVWGNGSLLASLGVVAFFLRFPLPTTLALQTTSASHSAVVIGALPMATAVISTLRTGNRPSWALWSVAAT